MQSLSVVTRPAITESRCWPAGANADNRAAVCDALLFEPVGTANAPRISSILITSQYLEQRLSARSALPNVCHRVRQQPDMYTAHGAGKSWRYTLVVQFLK